MTAIFSCWKLFIILFIIRLCKREALAFPNPFKAKKISDNKHGLFGQLRQHLFGDRKQSTGAPPSASTSEETMMPTQLHSYQMKSSYKNLLDGKYDQWHHSKGSVDWNIKSMLGEQSVDDTDNKFELIVSMTSGSCQVSSNDHFPLSNRATEESTQHDLLNETKLSPGSNVAHETSQEARMVHNRLMESIKYESEPAQTVEVDSHTARPAQSNSGSEAEKAEPVHHGLKASVSLPREERETLNESPAVGSSEYTEFEQSVSTEAEKPARSSTSEMSHYHYVALFCFMFGIVCAFLYTQLTERFETWARQRVPRYIAQLEQKTIRLLQEEQYEQVRTLLHKELPEVVRLRGEKHADSAAFRHFLAKALLALGDCGGAAALLHKVLHCYEGFGEDLYMAHALEDLGLAQQQLQQRCTGKDGAALRTMQHALRIFVEEATVAATAPNVSRRLYAGEGSSSIGSSSVDERAGLSAWSSPADSVSSSCTSCSSVTAVSPQAMSTASTIVSTSSNTGFDSTNRLHGSGRSWSDADTDNTSEHNTLTFDYLERALGGCDGDYDGNISDSECTSTSTATSPLAACVYNSPSRRVHPRKHVERIHEGSAVLNLSPDRLQRTSEQEGKGSNYAAEGVVQGDGEAVGMKKEVRTECGIAMVQEPCAEEGSLRQALEELEQLLMEPSLSLPQRTRSVQDTGLDENEDDFEGMFSAPCDRHAYPAQEGASMESPAKDRSRTNARVFSTPTVTPATAPCTRYMRAEEVEAQYPQYPACPHVARLLQRLASIHVNSCNINRSSGDSGGCGSNSSRLGGGANDPHLQPHLQAGLECLQAARRVHVSLHGEVSAHVRAVDQEIRALRARSSRRNVDEHGAEDEVEEVVTAVGGTAEASLSAVKEGGAAVEAQMLLQESPTTVVSTEREGVYLHLFCAHRKDGADAAELL